MAIHLRGSILTQDSFPASDLLRLLGAETGVVQTVDPATQSVIKFSLTEPLDAHSVSVLILYSVTNAESYHQAIHTHLPNAQQVTRADSSFIMLLGLNDEVSPKQTNSQDVEEFAASHGVFHMELFLKSKRNVELTLKLMRIRAASLLKKNPAIAQVKPKPAISVNATPDLQHEQQVTPQFSSRGFDECDLGQVQVLSDVVSVGDLSEPADLLDTRQFGSLSFSDQSEESFNDTLGSPTAFKEPKVPLLEFDSFDTERRPNAIAPSVNLHSTERQCKEPLLVLEILLRSGPRKIEVQSGDDAFELAREVLGTEDGVADLGELIYEKVTSYCEKVRAAAAKRVLFKVKVSIGSKAGEVVVKEGDDFNTLAEQFIRDQGLAPKRKPEIVELLQLAKKRHV